MLQRLRVNRFKSIRSQDIEFGRVNLFIGGNGAGKSNILEAIGLASASLGRSLGDSDLNAKGIRLSAPELMKSAHKSSDTPKTLELIGDFDSGVSYKCNLTSRENDPHLRFHSESCFLDSEKQFARGGNGSTVFGETLKADLDKHRGMWDQVRVAFDFDKSLSKTLQDFAKYAIYSPQTDFLRGIKGGGVSNSPVGLHGEGLALGVKSVIEQYHRILQGGDAEKGNCAFELTRRALDLVWLPKWTNSVRVGEITNKSLVSREVNDDSEMVYFIDKFMKEGRNTLTAYDSSEGTLFLLFIAVVMAHPEAPRYFALDNVDNALNPRLTRELVETMIDLTKFVAEHDMDAGPRQIFLTSHNPTSLDAFDLFDDSQKVFVVKRNDKGHTILDQLKPKSGYTREQWAKVMNGRNLSQLWLDGVISGANGMQEDI